MNIARRHFLNLAAGAVAMPAVSRLAHAAASVSESGDYSLRVQKDSEVLLLYST